MPRVFESSLNQHPVRHVLSSKTRRSTSPTIERYVIHISAGRDECLPCSSTVEVMIVGVNGSEVQPKNPWLAIGLQRAHGSGLVHN